MGHLNRGQLVNQNWRTVLVLFHIFVLKLNNAPDPATKKPVILGRIFLRNGDILNAQIRELRLIAVRLDVQVDGDLINHGIAAPLT